MFARNLLGAGHARTNVEIRMLNYMECLALIRSQARSNKQQGDVCEGGGYFISQKTLFLNLHIDNGILKELSPPPLFRGFYKIAVK